MKRQKPTDFWRFIQCAHIWCLYFSCASIDASIRMTARERQVTSAHTLHRSIHTLYEAPETDRHRQLRASLRLAARIGIGYPKLGKPKKPDPISGFGSGWLFETYGFG